MKTEQPATSTVLSSTKLKCTSSTAAGLQKRLRSISRTRREALVKKSEYIERLLYDLIAQLSDSATLYTTTLQSTAVQTKAHQSNSIDFVTSEINTVRESSRTSSIANLVDGESHFEARDFAICQSLVNRESSQPGSSISRVPSTVVRPYSTDLEILHSQLDFLNQELEGSRRLVELSQIGEAEQKTQLEVLRSQLLEARHDTIELRLQAAELLDTQNREAYKSATPAKPVALTWEEQKKQLLRDFELENEAIDFSSMSAGEFESLYVSVKRELADRDLQIAELKATLELQSKATTDGNAMGAAAINQLLDADSFIQEERERLRQLQDELQQKLRDAEIEISVERARIARDRLSLQNASQSFAEESQAAHDAGEAQKEEDRSDSSHPSQERKLVPGSIPRTRRWLQRLGLREDD